MGIRSLLEGRPTRRSFFGQVAAGFVAMNVGLRRLFSYGGTKGEVDNPFIMESPPGPETVIDGKRYLYFSGTGYYALQGHPALIRAGCEAMQKYGISSATTRSGYGNNPVLLEAERKAAEFFGSEDSVYLVSGYLSNITLALGLSERYDAIFLDANAHYSVREGAYVTRKPVFTFAHRDPDDLRKNLSRHLKAGQKPLVMSDGIFPTFGSICPVPDYCGLLESYGGLLLLDDAHAVGVLGPQGRGTYDYYGLKSPYLFFAGTLSKAFGGHGGIIPGSADFTRHLKTSVGAFIGASPTPVPAAAVSAKGVELVMKNPEMRKQLWQNARQLKTGLANLGFKMDDTVVPIATWTLSSAEAMKRVHQELMNRGIVIQYTSYAGAPAGGVLRAVVFSTHSPEQIQRLLEELRKLV